MPPITNQQRRDFIRKVDAFEKKLESLTEKDLEKVTVKYGRSGNNTYAIAVPEEIENMVAAYDELFELDNAAFKQSKEHLNADRQLKAYYAACEKLGVRFWNRVQAAMPEDLVKSKIADSQNAVNSDDPKKAAESVNDALHAVRKAKNWESLVPEIEKLYHAAEEKFGYDVFNGTSLSFGHRLREVGFNLQMESFEKMLENFDSNVHTDLIPFAVKFEAASSCAYSKLNKERCDKVFQAAVDKLGVKFCNHLSAVPQEFADKEFNSFFIAASTYDKSENPEKAQNLTTKYLDTVKLYLKSKITTEKKDLVQNMYNAVKEKCGEAAADRILEIDDVSYKLSDLVNSINARKEAAKKSEQAKQAEQEMNAGFAWKGKWTKPLEIVNENFLDPKLVNWVLDARSAADKKNQPILNSDEDRALLNRMADNSNLLYDFAIGNHIKPIDDVVKNVYEDYAKAREHFTEEISSGEVGSPLYKARLEALTACGAMGLMASRFISVAKENNLGFENVKDVDPMKTLRETLSVLRDEMERIPKSGSDTRLYSDLNNALNGVIDNAGVSLEELHTAAEQYFNARKGVVFSPFTAAGKQRLDIANRVIGFLDVAHYKRLDAMSKVKEDKPEVKAKPEEPKVQTKPEEPKVQTKPEEPKVQTKPEEPKVQTKPAEPKVQTKPAETKVQTKPAEPKAQTKPAETKVQKNVTAGNLSESIYAEVHNKCITLMKDKGILTYDQAAAIDAKADAGTFAQKEYLNNFLNKEKDVQALAEQFHERADFENALDNVLKELNSNSVKQSESAALTQQNTLNNNGVGEAQQAEQSDYVPLT